MKRLGLPFTRLERAKLKAGMRVLLSGAVYTARDAAHKRLADSIKKGRKVPIPLRDSVIYYAGPGPARPGMVIGSCGPTTSSRMDPFTLPLIRKGLGGMIGKGTRSEAVRRAIKKHGAVYFIAVGGAGALLSGKVKKAKKVCFKDLGPEAIYRLEMEDFPVIVAIDTKGRDIYERR